MVTSFNPLELVLHMPIPGVDNIKFPLNLATQK